MELITLFFLSFGVGFSGAMMPGPLLAVDIAESPRQGWQTGPVISIGHAIAEIAVVVALALGFVALNENETLARGISIVGGAALFIMGIHMGYDVLKRRLAYEAEKGERRSQRRLAGKGLVATLSNPYWFVWWATTGLAFVVKSLKFGVIGPVVFYFGHIMSDFVWYSAVSVIVWQGKHIIMGKGLKALILCCAVFLVYLGVSFIVDGVAP